MTPVGTHRPFNDVRSTSARGGKAEMLRTAPIRRSLPRAVIGQIEIPQRSSAMLSFLEARETLGIETARVHIALLNAAADDAEYQAWVGAFQQGLALLGWTIGRNVRINTHWATTNA